MTVLWLAVVLLLLPLLLVCRGRFLFLLFAEYVLYSHELLVGLLVGDVQYYSLLRGRCTIQWLP